MPFCSLFFAASNAAQMMIKAGIARARYAVRQKSNISIFQLLLIELFPVEEGAAFLTRIQGKDGDQTHYQDQEGNGFHFILL